MLNIGGTIVSVVGMGSMSNLDPAPSAKQKMYQRMFDHLGMGDHTAVSNLIVTKIGNNLKYWSVDQEIIGKTLELLSDMAGGYSSSKLLLTLDTVRFSPAADQSAVVRDGRPGLVSKKKQSVVILGPAGRGVRRVALQSDAGARWGAPEDGRLLQGSRCARSAHESGRNP